MRAASPPGVLPGNRPKQKLMYFGAGNALVQSELVPLILDKAKKKSEGAAHPASPQQPKIDNFFRAQLRKGQNERRAPGARRH